GSKKDICRTQFRRLPRTLHRRLLAKALYLLLFKGRDDQRSPYRTRRHGIYTDFFTCQVRSKTAGESSYGALRGGVVDQSRRRTIRCHRGRVDNAVTLVQVFQRSLCKIEIRKDIRTERRCQLFGG